MIVYSQIDLVWQRKLKRMPIATYETRLQSEAEEAELFCLLNFAGTAQSAR